MVNKNKFPSSVPAELGKEKRHNHKYVTHKKQHRQQSYFPFCLIWRLTQTLLVRLACWQMLPVAFTDMISGGLRHD